MSYSNSFRKGEKMAKEEELKMFMNYIGGDTSLEKILVEKYLYIVFRVALSIKNKNYFSHFLFGDLVQEGVLGLIKAIQTFKIQENVRFFFYAQRVIRGYIYNALRQREATVRIPNNIYRDVREINKDIKRLLRKLGDGISINEIASILNLSRRDIEKLSQVFQKTISLDTPLGDEGDGGNRYDILKAKNVPDQFSALVQKERMEKISEAIECLNNQEKKVLILRFGLLGRNYEMTFLEIGKELNLTKQRIKQIEQKALLKIKRKHFRNSREDFF